MSRLILSDQVLNDKVYPFGYIDLEQQIVTNELITYIINCIVQLSKLLQLSSLIFSFEDVRLSYRLFLIILIFTLLVFAL